MGSSSFGEREAGVGYRASQVVATANAKVLGKSEARAAAQWEWEVCGEVARPGVRAELGLAVVMLMG